MNKAYKYRIYPTEAQQKILAKTFGCVRFVYNKMLADKIKYYEETGKTLKNTPARYKAEFEWLKEVDSLALCNAQLNLQAAYKNFFQNQKSGFPKFKSKKHNKSYTTNVVGNNIRLENGKLKLPKVGFVIIKLHRQIPSDAVLKSVTVSQTASGKYYVSILTEYERHIEPVKIREIIGLDYSSPELYVSSGGDVPHYPHFYRKAQQKLAAEQRRLSKCEFRSNNYYKQKRKVNKIQEHITNQRKDFLHKQSRQIANVYDLVCVEDLDLLFIASADNEKKLGKSVADNGWNMFVSLLRYKLEEMGKQLVKVDRYFPSSQLCNECGRQNPAVKDLSVRKWVCPHCGAKHDRDVNAAVNIRNEGMRIALA